VQTQNSVYEIVSDVNSRQDIMEDRMASLEDKLANIQVSLDLLPDLLSRWEPWAQEILDSKKLTTT
jgi:potassium intermediate/small conductance calcium-activated channel subfamily N